MRPQLLDPFHAVFKTWPTFQSRTKVHRLVQEETLESTVYVLFFFASQRWRERPSPETVDRPSPEKDSTDRTPERKSTDSPRETRPTEPSSRLDRPEPSRKSTDRALERLHRPSPQETRPTELPRVARPTELPRELSPTEPRES